MDEGLFRVTLDVARRRVSVKADPELLHGGRWSDAKVVEMVLPLERLPDLVAALEETVREAIRVGMLPSDHPAFRARLTVVPNGEGGDGG